MIDRIAKRISNPEIWDPENQRRYPWVRDEQMRASHSARQAVEELLNPTEAMKLAAQKCELGGEDFAADHLEIYRAMLDEALS